MLTTARSTAVEYAAARAGLRKNTGHQRRDNVHSQRLAVALLLQELYALPLSNLMDKSGVSTP